MATIQAELFLDTDTLCYLGHATDQVNRVLAAVPLYWIPLDSLNVGALSVPLWQIVLILARSGRVDLSFACGDISIRVASPP